MLFWEDFQRFIKLTCKLAMFVFAAILKTVRYPPLFTVTVEIILGTTIKQDINGKSISPLLSSIVPTTSDDFLIVALLLLHTILHSEHVTSAFLKQYRF